MKSKETLKYGLGIVADFSSVDLSSKTFETDSVSLEVSGADVLKLSEVHEYHELYEYVKTYGLKNVGDIGQNIFYSTTAKNFTDAYVVHIEKKSDVTIKINQKNNDGLVYVLYVVSEDAKISEDIRAKNYLGYISDVVVNQDKNLTYTVLQNMSQESTATILRTTHVLDDATVTWNDVHAGGSKVNSSIYAHLYGDESTSSIYSMNLGNADQLLDIQHSSRHLSSHTESLIVSKNIFSDSAIGIHRSMIYMPKEAKKSVGKQKTDNLLLSKKAKLRAIPSLDIRTNDVECSHGVSTTNLDEETSFYFSSRGLSERDVRYYSALAHVEQVMKSIPKEHHPYVLGLLKNNI
jgi:Fe-S cluster assembly scaffold protein SufB